MNGFFNVYKQSGLTSSDVVVRLRGILRARTGVRYKVGHMGTLDPAAEGVLPIAVGSATKLFNYMLDKVKVYRADFVWGVTTDTLDATGTVTGEGPQVSDPDAVAVACRRLVGTYGQIPPQYSAKSVDGVRAYDLARRGVEVDLAPRVVTVYEIVVVRHEANRFVLDITCSGGTYIRSICRDMAALLGTVGHMAHLTRLRSGDFAVDDAVSLADIEGDYAAHFLPLARYAECLPCLSVDEKHRKALDNGMMYEATCDAPLVQVVLGGVPYGIGHTPNGILKIICRL